MKDWLIQLWRPRMPMSCHLQAGDLSITINIETHKVYLKSARAQFQDFYSINTYLSVEIQINRVDPYTDNLKNPL